MTSQSNFTLNTLAFMFSCECRKRCGGLSGTLDNHVKRLSMAEQLLKKPLRKEFFAFYLVCDLKRFFLGKFSSLF